MMRVVKAYQTREARDHAFDFYFACNDVAPLNYTKMYEHELHYDFVDGIYPTDIQKCYNSLQKHVWGSRYSTLVDPAVYISYCNQRALESLNRPDQDKFAKILSALAEHAKDFHAVDRVHGDATLSNMVQLIGSVVMIDPGHDRGLCVAELDEAKMMQSFMGYDYIKYRGVPGKWESIEYRALLGTYQIKCPFNVWRPHWLLLATHLVRLIHHQQNRGRLDLVGWALENIRNISNAHT